LDISFLEVTDETRPTDDTDRIDACHLIEAVQLTWMHDASGGFPLCQILNNEGHWVGSLFNCFLMAINLVSAKPDFLFLVLRKRSVSA